MGRRVFSFQGEPFVIGINHTPHPGTHQLHTVASFSYYGRVIILRKQNKDIYKSGMVP